MYVETFLRLMLAQRQDGLNHEETFKWTFHGQQYLVNNDWSADQIGVCDTSGMATVADVHLLRVLCQGHLVGTFFSAQFLRK